MGIDPLDAERMGSATAQPSPIPRVAEPEPFNVHGSIIDPQGVADAVQNSSITPIIPTKEANVDLVSGYVDALKREFYSSFDRAKDHARAVLFELKTVSEDEFRAFVEGESKAADIVKSGPPAEPAK